MLQAAMGGSGMSSIIMMVLIFGVFYLFMIRPQQKRQKELKKFRENLSIGDKVIINGAIYGKIKEISDYTVEVEISNNVKVTVSKEAIIADPNQQSANANKETAK